MKRCHLFRSFAYPILLAAVILATGCAKENTTEPTQNSQVSANSDAAESIASAVGENTGGTIDQMGDLLSLASAEEYTGLAKDVSDSGVESREVTYDPITGTWTVKLERERGTPGGSHYALIERTYTYQYLSLAGQPQQHWITEGDTARTILFNVIEAAGRHKTPRLSQALRSLDANLTATGCNTPLITINGSYSRAAVDTITTQKMVRTHDHELSLTMTDLQGPRGSRLNFAEKLSGTISGSYHALVTFTRGDAYSEKEIDRDFTIDLSAGSGELHLAGLKRQIDLFWGLVKE
jgi:hypothetical protein